MPIRTTLAALALTLATAVSAAAACSGDHARMSCAEGQVWDSATRSCVVQSS